MTDLDALAVQVGRDNVAAHFESIAPVAEYWPEAPDEVRQGKHDRETQVQYAILGARAMLAKLREMGLVVEPGSVPAPHNREPTAADFPTAYRPIKSITSNGTGHD